MVTWKLSEDKQMQLNSYNQKYSIVIDSDNNLIVCHILTMKIFIFSEFATTNKTEYRMTEFNKSDYIKFSSFESMRWFITDLLSN